MTCASDRVITLVLVARGDVKVQERISRVDRVFVMGRKSRPGTENVASLYGSGWREWLARVSLIDAAQNY